MPSCPRCDCGFQNCKCPPLNTKLNLFKSQEDLILEARYSIIDETYLDSECIDFIDFYLSEFLYKKSCCPNCGD